MVRSLQLAAKARKFMVTFSVSFLLEAIIWQHAAVQHATTTHLLA